MTLQRSTDAPRGRLLAPWNDERAAVPPATSTNDAAERELRLPPRRSRGDAGETPSEQPTPRIAPPLVIARPAYDFAEIYETHFDFVWRSLRLLGVADAAVEDAIQDTFSVVSRQLAQFEGRSSLRTWIFAILHRVAANHRRARQRKQGPLEPLEEMPSDDPTPDAHAEALDAARSIERFCAALTPDRRALFVLAVLEEAPAAEVAATLGLPIHKVYSRVHTLREGLRRELGAHEADHG